MKPLNRKERRIAFMKFLGVFLLAIAIVLSSAFVAGVKIPPTAYSKQGQVCQEREILVQYVDSLDKHIAVFRDMDKVLAGIANEVVKGEQIQKIEDAEIKLKNLLGRIKNLKTDLPEKNAVFSIGDSYLLLRTIGKKTFLQKPSPPPPDDCEPWKKRLQEANDNITALKSIANNASNDLDNVKVGLLNPKKKRELFEGKIDNIISNLDGTKEYKKIPEY